MRHLFPICFLLMSCDVAREASKDASLLRSRAEESEAVISFDVQFSCDEDVDDACSALTIDASGTTSTEGEIVSWLWSLDRVTSDSSIIDYTPDFGPDDDCMGQAMGTLTVEDSEGNTARVGLTGAGHQDTDPVAPFWTFSAQPSSLAGEGHCSIDVVAVGGCLTDDIDIVYVDQLTGVRSTVFTHRAGFRPPPYPGVVLVKFAPPELIISLQQPTPEGTFYVEKTDGEIISCFSSTCNPFSD
ncbi:MAG: hypothetical protein AAFV53_36005 [Myxococcota bacterium]